MMHELYVDYLQCSHLYREQSCREQGHKEISGTKFYSRGYEDELGRRRYFGNPNSKKCLAVYSGRAMHNMRLAGWGDELIISNLLDVGASVSRIDFAITDYIENDLITPDDVRQSYQDGEITGTLANYGGKVILGQDVGATPNVETFYIGDPKRRGKSGIFRAYDKGIELDIEQFLITRLELEERGENAHNSAKRLASGAKISQLIESRLKFKNKQFERFFDSEPIDISRGEKIVTDGSDEMNDRRWIWLCKQVAPAIRKAIAHDRKRGLGDKRLVQFLEMCGIVAMDEKSIIGG